jgi:sugar transferase (PEP-CTERM/EpsH1 system associated)
MMRHIIHVLHSLDVGGTENGTVNLVNALRGDFRHTVVAMTVTGRLAARLPGNVSTYALGKRPGSDWNALVRLARLLRRLRPDIVHSRNWAGLDAVLAARFARRPVVIHGEHGREASDPRGRNRRRNRIRRLMAPLVTRFVAVSHELGDWLTATVGIDAAKVTVIHNGVDLERFDEGDRHAARRALGLSEAQTAIGTVGRLDPVKDQLGLLDAFARLAAVSADAVLVIAGDGPCRAALERRRSEPDLSGRVLLLGDRPDVPVLLRALDVFALPSIAEGISNTILEAMASGLPVVATATGGNPEVVEAGVTGLLVPVGDRSALAAALGRYVADRHLAAVHGKAGRQRAVEHFSVTRMAERYGDAYRSLLASRRGGA